MQLLLRLLCICLLAWGAMRGAAAAPADMRRNTPTQSGGSIRETAVPAADTANSKQKRRMELPKSGVTETADTNKVSRLFCFNLQPASNDVIPRPIDTSLRYYATDYPFFRQDVGAIFLGNLGSPVIYYDYFKRQHNSEFFFTQPYTPYFLTPENVTHYNTTTPYSLLYYTWTTQKRTEEMQLRLLHTQSITNEISFGMRFDNTGTVGIYPRQNAKVYALNVFASYLGEYYSANAGFIYNRVKSQQNGGLTEPDLILDPNFEHPEGTATRLAMARNQLWQTTWYASHSLDFPLYYIGTDSVISNILKGRIGHSFEITSNSRLYTDTEDANADSLFYENYYIDRTKTRDSLALRRMENRLFLQLRPLRAYIFEHAAAGMGWRRYSTYIFSPDMYFTGNRAGTPFNSFFAYASASAWYKRYFLWKAYGESVIAGYRAGDFSLNADLKLSVYPVKEGIHLIAKAELSSMQPSYFYLNYFSNHYQWNHTENGSGEPFYRVTETKFTAALNIPQMGTDISLKYGLHNNYIYFDENRTLRQSPQTINVLALTLNQDFRMKYFTMSHRLLLQKSDEPTILDLPLVSANITYTLGAQLIRKVIYGEIGIDVQYCTPYGGYGYDPSLGMFYNSGQRLGGYLWADVFLAFRWKTATPFLKWEHANQYLWTQPYGYFAATGYPRNMRIFKFGLSWKFFD